MNKTPFLILRIGLAVTFLWIGVLILKQPEAWGGYLQPWAAELLPVPIEQAMMGTAVMDIIIGAMLLFSPLVGIAALVGSIHLIVILVMSGITDITVRDIGILAGTLAIMADTLFLPAENFVEKIRLFGGKNSKTKNEL